MGVVFLRSKVELSHFVMGYDLGSRERFGKSFTIFVITMCFVMGYDLGSKERFGKSFTIFVITMCVDMHIGIKTICPPNH